MSCFAFCEWARRLHIWMQNSLAGSLRLVGLAALFADPLQLRLFEKKRELVRMDEVNKLIDGICDVVLTHLSSLPARCAPRGDLGPGATSSGSCSRCAARPPTSASRWPTSAVSRRSMNRADEFSRWECFRCSH